jgi:parallel beta-helix repeat protein
VYLRLGAATLLLLLAGCQPSRQDPPASDTSLSIPTTPMSWKPTVSPIPDSAVVVEPADDLAQMAAEQPEGTTFFVRSGIHRIDTVVPRAGQTFLGEAGTVLSGARLVEGFEQRGEHWVAPQTPAGIEERGECESERPCKLAEELFVDGQPLRRVGSRAEVSTATWFFDLQNHEVVLSSDPTGAQVEMSRVGTAFDRGHRGVTIRGLVIEKFASPAQFAAVMPDKEWTIEGSEIRFNHGIAVKVAAGDIIRDNYIHHNGQFGLAGGGIDSLIENNEIAANNTAGFSAGWGAGGAKFVRTQNLVVRGNLVYANRGPGLWTDGSNENVLYEENVVRDNAHSGIKHELGGSATIRDNQILGNGFAHPADLRGAGILVRESSGVEIVGNFIVGNADALILLHDADRKNEIGARLDDVKVLSNVLALDGGHVGYTGDLPGAPILDGNLVFEGNTYVVDDGARLFLDDGDRFDFETWAESGREMGAVRVESLEEVESQD